MSSLSWLSVTASCNTRGTRFALDGEVTVLCCSAAMGFFKRQIRYATVALPLLFTLTALAQQPRWQKEIEDDKSRATRGQTTTFGIPPGANVRANWPPGLYEYYNGPQPFCYAYVIPGDWKVGAGPTAYTQDGRVIASVRLRPPSDFRGVSADNLLDRARELAIRDIERIHNRRRPLVDVELVPFEATRGDAWLLKAAPIYQREGRQVFPAFVILNLGLNSVAEITVIAPSGAEDLARQIVGTIRTRTDPSCFLPELERLYKEMYGEN